MNQTIVALAFCVLGVAASTVHAQTGTVINSANLDSWSVYGPQTNVRISDAKVTGGAAIEVTVPKKSANAWDAAAVADVFKPIHKGDHIHIAVPLKGKLLDGNGRVKLYMVLQFNSPPYNPIGEGKPLTLSSDWQTFVLDVVADKDYAPLATAFLVHLATGKQVVDIGIPTITDETK